MAVEKHHVTTILVDDQGRPTREFFLLLDSLIDLVNDLEARLATLEATVATHHP